MRHIIVDGYNVIRADPRLLSFERTSLEGARDILARSLGSAPRLANDSIMLVFDGTGGNRSHVHTHRLGRVTLVYSARGQTADEVIVRQARELARTGRVIVVSNDVEVRERCRAEGCELSSSENLLSQLPGASRRSGAATPADDEYEPTLSTTKRGNPRRAPRRSRERREPRF